MRLNENNCTCCGEKWSFSKIIDIENDAEPTKCFLGIPYGWKGTYILTYVLKCNNCNIETKFYKSILRDKFKQSCETSQQKNQKVRGKIELFKMQIM